MSVNQCNVTGHSLLIMCFSHMTSCLLNDKCDELDGKNELTTG